MDTLITILKDFQPAGLVIVAVAAISMLGNRTIPRIGPWTSLIAIAGTAAFVGNRIVAVESPPAWLLPLAIAGAVTALGAAIRLVRAISAHSYNDHTVAYVFPTALAISALWLSVALINFTATHANVVDALTTP